MLKVLVNKNIFHQFFVCSLSKMPFACESKTCYQHYFCKIFLVSLFSWAVQRVWVLLLQLLVEILTLIFSLVIFFIKFVKFSLFFLLIFSSLEKLNLSLLASELNVFFPISFGTCLYFVHVINWFFYCYIRIYSPWIYFLKL